MGSVVLPFTRRIKCVSAGFGYTCASGDAFIIISFPEVRVTDVVALFSVNVKPLRKSYVPTLLSVTTICPELFGTKLANVAAFVLLPSLTMVIEVLPTVKMVELPALLRLAYKSRLYFLDVESPEIVSVRNDPEYDVYRNTSGGAIVPP